MIRFVSAGGIGDEWAEFGGVAAQVCSIRIFLCLLEDEGATLYIAYDDELRGRIHRFDRRRPNNVD